MQEQVISESTLGTNNFLYSLRSQDNSEIVRKLSEIIKSPEAVRKLFVQTVRASCYKHKFVMKCQKFPRIEW